MPGAVMPTGEMGLGIFGVYSFNVTRTPVQGRLAIVTLFARYDFQQTPRVLHKCIFVKFVKPTLAECFRA